MPTVPAFIASRAEKWFGKPARVAKVEPLGSDLRRVVFEGPQLRHSSWRPGEAVEFRVSSTALRHYTPTSWDNERGHFEVIFYLNGYGPGSTWAEKLTVGEQVFVLGPGEPVRICDARRQVFLGDETTIGLFMAMNNAVKSGSGGNNASAHVVIEATENAAERLAVFMPEFTVLRRSGARGNVLDSWASENVKPDDAVYLVGHAQTIQRLRKQVVDSRGVSRSLVRTRAYWADGKEGL